MKIITILLTLLIVSFGTTTLFAGGDEWSASQKVEKEKQEARKAKVEKKEEEKKKQSDQ